MLPAGSARANLAAWPAHLHPIGVSSLRTSSRIACVNPRWTGYGAGGGTPRAADARTYAVATQRSGVSGECTCNHGFVRFGLRQSVRIGRMYHRLRRSLELGSYLHRAGAQDQCCTHSARIGDDWHVTESTICGKSAIRSTI
jgi:hypothetical protein